jgi:hypothetical protein
MTMTCRLTVSALAAAILVGCSSTVPPEATEMPPPQSDWAEENDGATTATPITLDFHATDLTITPGDVDWFTFTLDRGARVIVDLWPWTPGFYPLVVLLDDALQLVATNGFSFGAEVAAGTYFVALTAGPDYTFTGHHSASGYYSLSIIAVATQAPDALEPNDTRDEATPIVLDHVSPELTITSGDVDWFAFTLVASATVVAYVDTRGFASTLDTMLGLFDANGDLVAWDDDYGGSYDPRIETHLGPGTYYIAVTGYPDFWFLGDHAQDGSYRVSVRATP